MKICFIVGTLARGGAEKQLIFMLRALEQSGGVADVLCLTKGEAYEKDVTSIRGVALRHIGESRNRVSRLWNITRAVRETGAKIIQSSHFYTNIYAGGAGRFLGIPSIGAIRSDLEYEVESHKLTGALQIRLPDLLITNSAVARDRLLERGLDPMRIEFVRNVVEAEDSPANGQPAQGLEILFVGRLDANKKPERFLRLASILTRTYPQLKLQFKIVGDGEKRKELEETARRLDLAPPILSFLGDSGRMDEVYRAAHILVATSDREGTPNVILEAMAYSLPVVATAVGGTRDILDATRGILVKPNDENALVEATAKLILNHDLRRRLGSAGNRYVRENHSPDTLKNRLCEIYETLLEPRGRSRAANERSLGF